jgi:hypothetical protein
MVDLARRRRRSNIVTPGLLHLPIQPEPQPYQDGQKRAVQRCGEPILVSKCLTDAM